MPGQTMADPDSGSSRSVVGILGKTLFAVVGTAMVLAGIVAFLLVWQMFAHPGGIGAERLLGPLVGLVGLVLLVFGIGILVLTFGHRFKWWQEMRDEVPKVSPGDVLKGEQFEPRADRPRDLR